MLALKNKMNTSEYGCIIISIRDKMDDLKITKKEVLQKTGLKNEVFNRYYYSDIKRIDREVLAKICSVLDCDVSEIITYKQRG